MAAAAEGEVPRTTSLSSLKRVASSASNKTTMAKKHTLIAFGIFVLLVARVVWSHFSHQKKVGNLLAAFDKGKDNKLSITEMAALLGENGVDLDKEQVKKWFGQVDDEHDGFDVSELEQVMDILQELPNISARIKEVAAADHSIVFDMFILGTVSVALASLVQQQEALQGRWAASAFVNAVQYRRMQARCTRLTEEMAQHATERQQLQADINALEANSSEDLIARDRNLRKLEERLKEVQEKEDKARRAFEDEVEKWQKKATDSMGEASRIKGKMDRMMFLIKGLDAFAGKSTGKLSDEGAQPGFAGSIGFAKNSITFGTIDEGQLVMYETGMLIGRGRNSAYKCTDLTTGRELALKMYRIMNKEDRIAVRKDLFAHKEKVGNHPRIVRYERVIESESMIFVLMELIQGQDLFDVVISNALTEAQARHLFKEIVESLLYIHERNVYHCDVKPENVMVVGDVRAGSAHIKLIDFGCSSFSKYEQENPEGCTVVDLYSPPELLSGNLAPAATTDMWRLGCTLYVMLVRKLPFSADFHSESGRQTRASGEFFKIPEFEALSAEAKDLIAKLINRCPKDRLTGSEVLAHPWVCEKKL